MKIAIFNCHERSVPPKKSGGIEKIINYLIEGFIKRGHAVSLFSTGDSLQRHGMELVAKYPHEIEAMTISDEEKGRLNTQWTLDLGETLVARQHDFDIVNDHCLGSGVPILAKMQVPLVSTLHKTLTFDEIERLTPYKNNKYISISYAQRKPFPELNFIANIYNAIDVDASPQPRKREDYLVFVGRISEQKSPHFAIEVAKHLGKKLYILGKYKDKHVEANYYNNYFLPALQENKRLVEWIDEVDQKTVQEYLNKAYVSLHTARYRESFGLTLIESMAAGCPVIAFNHGAIPEIVEEGKNGFIVEDAEVMAAKVNKIDTIDGNYCREYVKKRFDVDIMVENYLDTFQQIVSKK